MSRETTKLPRTITATVSVTFEVGDILYDLESVGEPVGISEIVAQATLLALDHFSEWAGRPVFTDEHGKKITA